MAENTTLDPQALAATHATEIEPGGFEPSRHFYPRVLNASIHPLVSFFMHLGNERLVSRFCHLNPQVRPSTLTELLATRPSFFRWSGADLFHTTTAKGLRRMVLIETNSCPSGNKAMPILREDREQGGYRRLLERCFQPLLRRRGLPRGGLAVLFDKNSMEAGGYAASLADLTGERVYLVPLPASREAPARFDDGVLQVRDASGSWHPIRAAFRYVTQKPWTRIPIRTKTLVFNPSLVCLAGGRNKLVASKAYEFFNAELAGTGLKIRTPATVRDVSREEIPLWVRRFGGHAVVKVPYSNAGQGIFTITTPQELEAAMATPTDYERFIVQSLIGNHAWCSETRDGRLYHVGTAPNRRGEIYAADLRMMVSAGPKGFRPLALYARRARLPLVEQLSAERDSWEMLGTNLSVIQPDGGWSADTDRLLLTDRRDFNQLGLGLDDLIEAFVQAVLATLAIDRLCTTLVTQKGKLRFRLFRSLNDDRGLLEEVLR